MQKCSCGKKAEYTVTLTIEIDIDKTKVFKMLCCEECKKDVEYINQIKEKLDAKIP